MSKSNSPMNSDLMHETSMSEHVIQRVSKSPCIYVLHSSCGGSLGILKGKQKLGVTSNSNKLAVIDFAFQNRICF